MLSIGLHANHFYKKLTSAKCEDQVLTDLQAPQAAMCQYYRWKCANCYAANDVVVRCYSGHQSNHPCPRIAEPLPLPSDAPKLECQQCFAHRPLPHARPDLNTNASSGTLSVQAPAIAANGGPEVPPEHDIFWLNPAMRLSDCTEKLGEYQKKRNDALAIAKKTQHSSDSGEEKRKDEVRNSAWEEAWSQLKEDLSKA